MKLSAYKQTEMGLRSIVVLVALIGAAGSLSVTLGPQTSAHPEVEEENEGQKEVSPEEEAEDVMATRELNPDHYEAQRAAKVVQLYLNTRFGSPYKVFGLERVHSGNTEDVGNSGRQYRLEISVKEIISGTTEKCSAEVFFPKGEKQLAPQVQVSSNGELFKINTKAEDEALYLKYKANTTLMSAEYLPDSYGNMAPDMTPFWHLCIVASSFIMLNESSEDTLYNMAQVARITQLPTENDQLKFDSLILLHDMVSQEIPRWKLLFTWSPAEGVKVLQMEQQPRCQHC